MTDIKVGDRIRVVRVWEGTVERVERDGMLYTEHHFFNQNRALSEEMVSQTFEVLEPSLPDFAPGSMIRHTGIGTDYVLIARAGGREEWVSTRTGTTLQEPPKNWRKGNLEIIREVSR